MFTRAFFKMQFNAENAFVNGMRQLGFKVIIFEKKMRYLGKLQTVAKYVRNFSCFLLLLNTVFKHFLWLHEFNE